jgi:hypothetical protein
MCWLVPPWRPDGMNDVPDAVAESSMSTHATSWHSNAGTDDAPSGFRGDQTDSNNIDHYSTTVK